MTYNVFSGTLDPTQSIDEAVIHLMQFSLVIYAAVYIFVFRISQGSVSTIT